MIIQVQTFHFLISETEEAIPLVEAADIQPLESNQTEEISDESIDDDQTIFEVFALQRMTNDKHSQARLNVHLELAKSYCLLFNSDSKLSGDGEGTLDKMPKGCFNFKFQYMATSLTKSELFLSLEQEDNERAKYLLSKGTNPNIRTADNQTPLHLASEKGNLDLVEMLLHKSADTEVHEPLFGR